MQEEKYNGFRGLMLREWHEILHNRTLRLCLVYFPVLALLFFTQFFKAQQPENLPLAILDEDNSATSSKLVNMLDAVPELHLVRNYIDLKSTEKALKQGLVYGVVAIPDGFEKSVMKGEQANVVMIYNNDILIPGGTVSKAVVQVSATMGTGINIKRNMMKGDRFETALQKAQPVVIDTHIMFNPTINYLFFIVAGILPAVLQIFVLMVAGFVFGRELRNGTANEWLSYARENILRAVLAKATPYLIIFSILSLSYNSILYDYLDVPMNGSRLMIELGQIAMILAYFGLSLSFIAWSFNMRLTISISAILGALAFSFSGLTFPTSGMPVLAQKMSQIFPFTHYLKLFLNQAFYGAPILSGLAHLAILLGFLILPILSLPRLKKVASDSKFYGRM